MVWFIMLFCWCVIVIGCVRKFWKIMVGIFIGFGVLIGFSVLRWSCSVCLLCWLMYVNGR